MTRLTGSALRVTLFVGENDMWHHQPLYTEIVHCEVIRYVGRDEKSDKTGTKSKKSL